MRTLGSTPGEMEKGEVAVYPCSNLSKVGASHLCYIIEHWGINPFFPLQIN